MFVMDILRIFRMQEPVSKDLLNAKTNELGQYKEAVQEKDVLLQNYRVKIMEMQEEIDSLKTNGSELENDSKPEESEYHKVMMNYESFFRKMLEERECLLSNVAVFQEHISNLESTLDDLMEKYSMARSIIDTFYNNQKISEQALESHKASLKELQSKYESFKLHSESKMAEANQVIEKKDKRNIQVVAKLKAKILESEAKINHLEKYVKFEDIRTRPSMFTPLKNTIKS